MTQPRKWSAPLGNGADVQDLPDDDLRYASFSKIFPQITQVPLSAGGVAPRRIDFNSLFKLLADNIYYYQNGGVFEYSAKADYEKGALVRYNDNIYLCIQDNSALNLHNPDDINYWLRIALNNDLANYLPLAGGNITGNLTVKNKNVVRSVNGVNADTSGNVQLSNFGAITGKIEWFAFNEAPDGYLVCNGANVSRETYADLFAAIGTAFGKGDGSTTFNIPDLRDRYIIGANTNALGTQIAEQLPNIRGSWGVYGVFVNYLYNPTGAYYKARETGGHHAGTGAGGGLMMDFDASRANSIYTDNGHVYPLSLALLPCIKY